MHPTKRNPERSDQPQRYRIRAYYRLVAFVLVTAYIVLRLWLSKTFAKEFTPWAHHWRNRWCKWSIQALGIRVHKTGSVPKPPFLLVGNHRSYIDPAVAVLFATASPVAKAEVRSWPIIGYGGELGGIIYVKRESKQSRRLTVEAIEKSLLAGIAVLIYPEGTTHNALHTRSFKTGGFKVAAQWNVPVVPCAIEYADPADYWVGDDEFIPHFIKTFSKPRVEVHISYGQSIQSNDYQELVHRCQTWIDEAIREMKQTIKSDKDDI